MVSSMPEWKTPEIRAGKTERQALGHRLREARRTAGFTLEKAAEALSLSHSAISQWEKGDSFPTADRLEKAAELYGVSMDWLMGKEKRIGETPELYYPGEALPTEEEMRLAMDIIRALRRHQFKHGDPDGPAPPGGDG